MPDTATLAVPDPVTLADALRVTGDPGFDRWKEQIRRTGGCASPLHLSGWTRTKDLATGEILHEYSTATEPGGRLRIACGNRRASRCPACAYTYAGDTYHLIRAGLAGDDTKGVPATVRDHPRVFATFTAPSFGPVHNRPGNRPCRCGTTHPEDSPQLGTPLDPDTYDYPAAVLFNNHAGDLWRRYTNRLRREVAARAGLSQRELKEVCRISYGKVAEFQRRGAVHFHAVIRIDGPAGADDPPPAWATHTLLTDAVKAAAIHHYTTVTTPRTGGQPARTLRFGEQLDIRPIKALGAGEELTEQAVASYVAKYATKAAETTGTLDRRIGELAELDRHDIPDHTRRLIRACRDLDRAYPERRLWAWAHMLGFRGHFSTKSRRYSTTLGALRQARADYRATEQRQLLGLPEDQETVLILADWQYAGSGHSPGESWLAATRAIVNTCGS
ncbi:replication initiator protein RepSA [Streptomyces litchfieldiae]|uniref:Replication initiator protein RepSA n=1 Tax=Streptomyces litchfieldiae TaxID=3075543 RepID=A0ABU2N0S6_9ACTN|nr:replication initiator protein RepSA [Streptomyces sp. DSM 44938]MDT0347508.1 replication initiator protein RepSA [Streptomyces sp. DSM 44938]